MPQITKIHLEVSKESFMLSPQSISHYCSWSACSKI